MRQKQAVRLIVCLALGGVVASCAEDGPTGTSPSGPQASVTQSVEVCETIDFDEFAHGDAVTSVNVLDMTLTVAASPWVDPAIDPRAYDTNTVDGPDPDLEWQGTAPECPACQGQGRVLLIPDNRGFDIEGDDHEGGRLTFTGFMRPVFVESWTAVDNDGNEVSKTFEVLDGGSWTTVSQAPASGNGTVEIVSSPAQLLFDTSMRFTFGDGVDSGSGAIDDIVLCTLEEEEIPGGGEGCTLGYWKTHTDQAPGNQQDAWALTGFATSTPVSDVFTVPAGLTDLNDDGDPDTLLDALSFRGGGGVSAAARILLKQAVAALLNASHPDVSFDLTADQVIADVNAALASGSRNTMTTAAGDLDSLNNQLCPLN